MNCVQALSLDAADPAHLIGPLAAVHGSDRLLRAEAGQCGGVAGEERPGPPKRGLGPVEDPGRETDLAQGLPRGSHLVSGRLAEVDPCEERPLVQRGRLHIGVLGLRLLGSSPRVAPTAVVLLRRKF